MSSVQQCQRTVFVSVVTRVCCCVAQQWCITVFIFAVTRVVDSLVSDIVEHE
jgi:hypothetical protein